MAGSVTRSVIIDLKIKTSKFSPPEGMETAFSQAGAKAAAAWNAGFHNSIKDIAPSSKFIPPDAPNPSQAVAEAASGARFTPGQAVASTTSGNKPVNGHEIVIPIAPLQAPSTKELTATMASAGTEAGEKWRTNFRDMINQAANEKFTPPPPRVPPIPDNVMIRRPGEMQKAADGFKMAGEGVLHLARGIAFLNAQSEEDLALAVRRIAYYQGLFDLYRGGTDTVKGLTSAVRSMALANATATAATAINNGTMASTTIGWMAAKNGASALATTLTGPVGIGLAAVSLAAGAGYLIWRDYQAELKKTEENAKKAATASDILYHSQVRLADVERVRYRLSSGNSQASELSKLALDVKAASGLDRVVQSHLDAQETRARSLQTIFRLGDAARLRRGIDLDSPAGLPDAGSQRKIIEDQAKFFAEIRKASEGMEGNKRPLQVSDFSQLSKLDGEIGSPNRINQAKELERLQAEIKADLSGQLSSQQTLVDVAKEQKQQIADRLALLGQERSALMANLEAEKGRSKAIKDQKIAEAQSRMTVEEKFGRLRPDQQQQVKDIGNQVEKSGVGSLRRDQRDLLDEYGLAQALNSRFYIDEAQKALGPDKKLFSQLQTFGTTPQEALAGGIEGEDRSTLLEFKQQFSNANSNAIRDTLKEVATSWKKESKEMEDAVKTIGSIDGKASELGTELTSLDRTIGKVLEGVKTSNRKIETLAAEVLVSNLSRR